MWSSAAVAHLLQGSTCCAFRDDILHTWVVSNEWLLMVLAIYGKAHYCYPSYLLMVLAIYGKATLVLFAISKFHFFSARYSSRSFCHRAMNEVSKRAA